MLAGQGLSSFEICVTLVELMVGSVETVSTESHLIISLYTGDTKEYACVKV